MKKNLLLFLFVGISRFAFASSVTVPEALKSVESETDWSMVGAIATCVAALTGIAAVVVYLKALRENQKLSKIASEQVRIQNSHIAFKTYKALVKYLKGTGNHYFIKQVGTLDIITFEEIFIAINNGIRLKQNVYFDFDECQNQFSSIADKLNSGISVCIDNDENLADYQKMQLIFLIGEYTGLRSIFLPERNNDCMLFFKDSHTGDYDDLKFSTTVLYFYIKQYNDIRQKYTAKVLNLKGIEQNKTIA